MSITTSDKREFYTWYRNNQRHLQNYTYSELFRLAYACGFRIAEWQEDMQAWLQKKEKLETFWDSPFREHWIDLMIHEQGKETN